MVHWSILVRASHLQAAYGCLVRKPSLAEVIDGPCVRSLWMLESGAHTPLPTSPSQAKRSAKTRVASVDGTFFLHTICDLRNHIVRVTGDDQLDVDIVNAPNPGNHPGYSKVILYVRRSKLNSCGEVMASLHKAPLHTVPAPFSPTRQNCC